jgi:crotonobetainyl-CoA:carnitine CoA-transferase CaiB-like acyl-CoA transferase
MVAGLTGFGAILMAIIASKKDKLGGQVIDLSLFEPLFSILGPWAASYQISGKIPPRIGNRSNVAAPRGIYKTKDNKFVSLSASMQSMWEKLAITIGARDLIKDIRFRTNSDRLRNQDDLDEVISKFIKKFNREPLLKKFSESGITVGPVLDISEIIKHPYVLDREILMEHYSSEYGNILMHQAFPRLSKTPGKVINGAPSIGQNTDDVLKEIGITKQQIEKLRKNKIIS